jgi:hypothetical protein
MGQQMVGYGELIGALDADYIGHDEEIGADELMGDELAGRGRRAVNVIKADRRYPMGMGSVVVPTGGTASLTAAPTLPFRVDRLMLEASAVGALVTSIVAGNVLQTLGGGGIPVEAFKQDSIGAAMAGQTLPPAIPVVVTLVNPTLADITVSGVIFGLADQ